MTRNELVSFMSTPIRDTSKNNGIIMIGLDQKECVYELWKGYHSLRVGNWKNEFWLAWKEEKMLSSKPTMSTIYCHEKSTNTYQYCEGCFFWKAELSLLLASDGFQNSIILSPSFLPYLYIYIFLWVITEHFPPPFF